MIEEKSIVAVTNILPNPHFTERWILYKMNNSKGVTDTLKKNIERLNANIAPTTYYYLTEYENIESKVKDILELPKEKWVIVDVRKALRRMSEHGVRIKIAKEVK